VNATVNLMIVPNYLSQFYEMITQLGIPYQLNIENVQTLIDQGFCLTTSFNYREFCMDQ